jgi:DNA-binding transcriptional MerR regulator
MKEYPSKLYYSISEVAGITEVKAHVLRYWETEFPTLKPKKTRTGSRRYRQADIEEIMAIKHLLYEEGFKIAGARKMRKQARSQASEVQATAAPQMALSLDGMDDRARLSFLKEELKSLLLMVKELKTEAQAMDEVPPLKEMKGEG